MGITDKILLGLLVLLLPLGIVVSKQLFVPETSQLTDERSEQLKKIETLLDELAKKEDTPSQMEQTPITTNGIQITQVEFASTSGSLTITGRQANFNVMVRIAVVEYLAETTNTQNLAVSNAKALGKPISWQAVKPNPDGSFEYEYLPDQKDVLLDISVEQLGKSDVAVFDLATEKLVYEANP